MTEKNQLVDPVVAANVVADVLRVTNEKRIADSQSGREHPDGFALVRIEDLARLERTLFGVPGCPEQVGQAHEDQPEHEVTGREMLLLLSHRDCNLDKPVDVSVPMGHATVSFAWVNPHGLYLSLSEPQPLGELDMTEKKYPRPQSINVVMTSVPEGLVDVEVRVDRGGKLEISLGDGPEADGPFALNLPGGCRDQRRWICDKDGMRPLLGAEDVERERRESLALQDCWGGDARSPASTASRATRCSRSVPRNESGRRGPPRP